MIELLVSIVIVGLLASAALATFLTKRVTAGDGVAKELIHTAQQTAVNYGLTNTYLTMTPAALKAIEPSINITANGQAVLVNAAPAVSGYLLTVVSSTANTFNLNYSNGVVTRSCIVAGGNGNTSTNTGGGCVNGKW